MPETCRCLYISTSPLANNGKTNFIAALQEGEKYMAYIAPFKGIRYNLKKISNIEDVLTPPYDVIDEEEGQRFLKKNPCNMIQLDLHNSSGQAGIDTPRYAQARDRFEQWQKEEILISDETPAIYLYYIEYLHPHAEKRTRRGLVSLVGLSDFSEQIVKPHEQTFAGVIRERLELMDTCEAQFSQVFSLYSDPEQQIINLLEQSREPIPLVQARDRDGNLHTLWRVVDQHTIDKVSVLFADKSLYIADGHHRYTTALACRQRALQRNPELPAGSPFNFIMMYLCGCEDPGLLVLPTHRLINYPEIITADRAAELVSVYFSVEEVKGAAREGLINIILDRMDETVLGGGMSAFGLYHAGEDRGFILRLLPDACSCEHLSMRTETLKKLDVVVLSDIIIEGIFDLDHEQCVRDQLVRYLSDRDIALDEAVKQSVIETENTPLLFLLNPTRVTQVTAVADKGEIMPHKSTYFYPKILTGLLINKLSGKVQVAYSS